MAIDITGAEKSRILISHIYSLNPVPINWATSRPVSSDMSTLTIVTWFLYSLSWLSHTPLRQELLVSAHFSNLMVISCTLIAPKRLYMEILSSCWMKPINHYAKVLEIPIPFGADHTKSSLKLTKKSYTIAASLRPVILWLNEMMLRFASKK